MRRRRPALGTVRPGPAQVLTAATRADRAHALASRCVSKGARAGLLFCPPRRRHALSSRPWMRRSQRRRAV